MNTMTIHGRLFVLFLLCVTSGLRAQDRIDTLYFANGSREGVIVTRNYKDHIDFHYPGEEDIPNTYDKTDFIKIVYRSGRVEQCGGQPVACDRSESDNRQADAEFDFYKFQKLKTDHYSGNFMSILGQQYKVNVIIARKVAEYHYLNETDIEQFSNLFSETVNKCITSNGMRLLTTPQEGERNANLYIVEVDDDGEVYGYVDFMKGDEVVLSAYINGNSRNAPLFATRMVSAAEDSAKYLVRQLAKNTNKGSSQVFTKQIESYTWEAKGDIAVVDITRGRNSTTVVLAGPDVQKYAKAVVIIEDCEGNRYPCKVRVSNAPALIQGTQSGATCVYANIKCEPLISGDFHIMCIDNAELNILNIKTISE